MTKILDTPTLVKAQRIAESRGYNRQVSKEFLDTVDPEGIHVVAFSLIHEYAAGVVVDAHVRAQILVKVKDTMEPERIYLDVDIELFNGLKEHAGAGTS